MRENVSDALVLLRTMTKLKKDLANAVSMEDVDRVHNLVRAYGCMPLLKSNRVSLESMDIHRMNVDYAIDSVVSSLEGFFDIFKSQPSKPTSNKVPEKGVSYYEKVLGQINGRGLSGRNTTLDGKLGGSMVTNGSKEDDPAKLYEMLKNELANFKSFVKDYEKNHTKFLKWADGANEKTLKFFYGPTGKGSWNENFDPAEWVKLIKDIDRARVPDPRVATKAGKFVFKYPDLMNTKDRSSSDMEQTVGLATISQIDDPALVGKLAGLAKEFLDFAAQTENRLEETHDREFKHLVGGDDRPYRFEEVYDPIFDTLKNDRDFNWEAHSLLETSRVLWLVIEMARIKYMAIGAWLETATQ